jgi:hypothetical protein
MGYYLLGLGLRDTPVQQGPCLSYPIVTNLRASPCGIRRLDWFLVGDVGDGQEAWGSKSAGSNGEKLVARLRIRATRC